MLSEPVPSPDPKDYVLNVSEPVPDPPIILRWFYYRMRVWWSVFYYTKTALLLTVQEPSKYSNNNLGSGDGLGSISNVNGRRGDLNLLELQRQWPQG